MTQLEIISIFYQSGEMYPSSVFTWLLELWSKVTSTGAGLQVTILDIGQSLKGQNMVDQFHDFSFASPP